MTFAPAMCPPLACANTAASFQVNEATPAGKVAKNVTRLPDTVYALIA
jgi:hypothetical protein